MMPILVVEDDPGVAALICRGARGAGMEARAVGDGRAGLEHALSGQYALAVVDVMLPGLDGFQLCKRLRQAENWTPVILLTSRHEESDRVLGLELGADDYVLKPFGMREL